MKGLTHRLIVIENSVKEKTSLMRLLDDLNLQYHIDDEEKEDF